MMSDVNIFADTAKEPVGTISRLELAAKSSFMYQLINSLNMCDGCGDSISIIFAEEKKETIIALMAEVAHFKKSGLLIIKDATDVNELRKKIGLNAFEMRKNCKGFEHFDAPAASENCSVETSNNLEDEDVRKDEQEATDSIGNRSKGIDNIGTPVPAENTNVETGLNLENRDRNNEEPEAVDSIERSNGQNSKHEEVNESIENQFSMTSDKKKITKCRFCHKTMLTSSYQRHLRKLHKNKGKPKLKVLKKTSSFKTNPIIKESIRDLKQCNICHILVSKKNFSRHLKFKHSSEGIAKLSNYGPHLTKIKKVDVNIENLNINSMKIKPDDPIPKRRLMLEKCDFDTSFKIVTPPNTSSSFSSVDHCSNCGLDYEHGPMISCTKCSQWWHLHCVGLDSASEEELAKDFFCYSCSSNIKENEAEPKSKNRCALCANSYFSKKSRLLQHYSRVHFKEELMKYVDNGSKKCRFCSFVSPNGVCSLVAHIGSTHKKVLQFLPFLNGEVVNHEGEGVLPKSKHDGGFKCIHCEIKLPTENQLDIHYCLDHYRDKLQAMLNTVDPKLCPHCGILIRNQTGMVVHIGTVHKKVEQLHYSNLRISSPVNFNCIFDISKQTTPNFKCQLCKEVKTYPTRSHLYEHYSTCHYFEELTTIVSDSDVCPICFKNVPNKNGLLRHIGSTHDKVELFLPTEFHLKRSNQSAKRKSKTEDSRSLKSKTSLKKRAVKKRKKILSSKSLYCKLCPETSRPSFVDRSKLFRHYSLMHYRSELCVSVNQESTSCKICLKKLSSIDEVISHIGSTHNRVNELLPEKFRIEKLRARGEGSFEKNSTNHSITVSKDINEPAKEVQKTAQDEDADCMKTEPFDAFLGDINDGGTVTIEQDIDLSEDSEPKVEVSLDLLDTENNINTIDPLMDCSIDIEENPIAESSVGLDFTASSIDMEEASAEQENNVDTSQDSIDTQALRSVFDSSDSEEED